ncbi:MAG TPA: YggS family pyridoxal phosphate-dependent enzyme [Candidatus Dormibacteraeota bacterium]|nr:YggS family pyridoxal phosphate-dependent enzyme [Candidatus Dormibacteraeota bacterium]
MSGVASRLASIRERIARAGRDPDEVTIVAVTKGFGVEACLEAMAAGLRVLGENRVQEALGKMEQVSAGRAQGALPAAEWHLIGHLQTNKVKQATGKFALIQTVDSLHLAEAIAAREPGQAVLVEVNVAREPQKSGALPEDAVDLVAAASALLEVRGLMAMGPGQGDPTPAFAELRRIRDEARERTGRALPVLSMGMSGDFEAALAAGSTMLRLGQALFGPRPT